MADNKTLKFKTNVPETVEFKYDNPKDGENEHGPWFLYGVKHKDGDAGFFATPFLNDLIQWAGVKKGATATITKKERPDGKSKFWTIEVNNIEYTTDDMAGDKKSGKGKKPPNIPPSEIRASIDDSVNTIVLCYKKVQTKAEHEGLELSEDTIQKLATSVFIGADRKGEYIASSIAREQPIDDLLDLGPPPPSDEDAPH